MLEKKKSIVKSTLSVTVITFTIKLLGLIKQSVLASYCGATDETDAFFISSGVLMALGTMTFSAISVSLLSVHTKYLITKGRDDSNLLINSTLSFFLPISALVSLLFFLCSSWIAKLLAPSYNGEQLVLLSHYVRLMSCVFVFSCYYLIVNVILETDKEFVPGRMYGFFQNIFLILSSLFLFSSLGMEALIWAFILSGFAECVLVTICAGKRLRFIFRRKVENHSEVHNLLKLSMPLILGNALYEINDIVDKQIASGLGTGNASYLTYGATINEIVTGVVVSSISIVIFSHFATWVAQGDSSKVREGLNQSIQFLILVIFPIMSLCLFAGDDIIRLLYGRGNFNDNAIYMTRSVVIGYAIGFIFSSIRVNMVKVFYAYQDTKRPLINSVISIVVNIVLSIVLSKIIGVGGIALSTSLAMILSTILLERQVRIHIAGYSSLIFKSETLKAVIAFAICSVPVMLIHTFLDISVFTKLLIEVIVCLICYFLVLQSMHSMTVRTIINYKKYN